MALVYRHRRLDTNEIFYVGISNNIKRPYRKDTRTKWWKNIVNKTEYNIEIIATDLSWEDAKELEIFLISLYGRQNIGTGSLVNLTDGGDGSLNIIVSSETRKKLSEANKGKKRNEETRNNISKGQIGRKFSEESKKKMSEAKKGRKLSEETKKKMSEARQNISDELRLKLSIAAKNMSIENREKITKGHLKNKTNDC